MHYKPKSTTALHVALGGLPPNMRVDVDPDIGVRATTVSELRKLAVWPDNLVVTTPPDCDRALGVRVSRHHHATRTGPKP